jgi:Flp pilus assembly protein TadG
LTRLYWNRFTAGLVPRAEMTLQPISVRAMTAKAIFARLRAAAGHFAGANHGNVAVIFGIAAVPLLSFVGAAIDYSRANSARSSMQAALDSAALMVAKDLTDGTIQPSDINTKSQAYFTALYTNKEAQSVTVSATYTPVSGSTPATVLINGSGSVTTDFMKLACRFPQPQLQRQLHLDLGQHAYAGRAGAG